MRVAALLAALLALAAALAPIDADVLPLGDKALHVLAFALIGGLAARGGARAWAVLAALAGFALLIELAQAWFTAGRSASLLDAAASWLGAGLGVAAARLTRPRALAAAACATLAIGAGLDVAVEQLRPAATQALLQRAWHESVASRAPTRPWPLAPGRAALALKIGDATIVVLDSSERRALALAPGLWPGSRPGEAGTSIIMGHRNGAFRALGEVEIGDDVFVESVDGARFVYSVTAREIVLWNRSGLRLQTPEEGLALVTCWPIGQTEPSQYRLIVRARPA